MTRILSSRLPKWAEIDRRTPEGADVPSETPAACIECSEHYQVSSVRSHLLLLASCASASKRLSAVAAEKTEGTFAKRCRRAAVFV